jgi:hypothetical protein
MNGYELMDLYNKQVKECIYVSNEMLPDEFQDHRTDGVTLATLEKKCDERDRLSDFERDRAERARRVEVYREQLSTTGEISYLPYR